MAGDDDGFFARWSRRKADGRAAAAAPAAPAAARELTAPPARVDGAVETRHDAAAASAAQPAAAPDVERPPLPTMDDVARLTRSSDFSRFVAPGVDDGVKRAALKKLFADPHFNVMDGLDVYVDDYHAADPLPPAMLRRLAQSNALGLFADAPPAAPGAAPVAMAAMPPTTAEAGAAPAAEPADTDEDADLRLQPHDAARRAGAEGGAGGDAGRER